MNQLFKILYVLCLLACINVHAQTKQMFFDKLGVDEGLPEGKVYAIHEDRLGYLWIASYEGLYKYDGKNLVPHDQGNDGSRISTMRAIDIDEDDDGNIWVSTIKGLNKIDSKTGSITQYITSETRKNAMPDDRLINTCIDSNGDIWVNTGSGITFYDREADSFILLTSQSTKNYASCMYEAPDKSLLIGMKSGLYEVDKKTLTIIPFVDSSVQEYLGSVRYIYNDNSGNVWVCTRKGMRLLDMETRKLTEAKILPEKWRDKYIWRVLQDKNNNYWMSVVDKLLFLDMKSGELIEYTKNDLDQNDIQKGLIIHLYEDHYGNIWITTDVGIYKINQGVRTMDFYQFFPRGEQHNKSNQVARIHQRADGSLIYHGYRKMLYSNSLGAGVEEIKTSYDRFMEEMCEMPNGETWVCYSKPGTGIWRFDEASLSVEKIRFNNKIDSIYTFYLEPDIDSANIYWIAADNGLYKYYATRRKGAENPIRVAESPNMRATLQTADRKLWYVSSNSLIMYDKGTGETKKVKRDHSSFNTEGSWLRDLTVAKDGKLWLAYDYGLSSYDPNTGKFKTFSTENGIKGGNIIYSILADNNGDIWFTTFNYIIWMDPVKEEFRYFSKVDGVNTTFNRRSRCKLNNGKLAFGGTKGIVVFHPDSIGYNSYQPNVVISAISVNSETYKSNILPEHEEQVSFSYADKVISFQFKALEYTDVNRNEYAYKMDGFDDSWVYVGTGNKATYTNLEPGEYTFTVKATNYNGIWSNKTSSLKVIVKPLFWQQVWFRLLVAALLLALIYYTWRSNKEKNRFKQQKEVAEQNDKYKTQFLSNVSHEIRTPLNAIIGLNKLLLDTPLTAQQHKYAHAAAQSSESLFTLINDLLDQAKIESGKFTFVERPFRPKDILIQVRDTFLHKAKEKGLYLSISLSDDLPITVLGDAVRLHQILSNLVSNAIKFTEQGGADISLSAQSLSSSQVELIFKVADTGVGIEETQQERIFDSFHQVEDNTANRNIGTGLGLSVSKQLVEQQGGAMLVESIRGKGSAFIFSIPYKVSDNTASLPADETIETVTIKGLKVLLVEDTPFNQLLAVEILKKNIEGVVVTVAENGQEALDIISKDAQFDIILMDVKMPIMDGYDASRAIRNMTGGYFKSIPIIALTANAVPEQLQQCKSAGMNDWITKPIDDKLLLNKIALLTKSSLND